MQQLKKQRRWICDKEQGGGTSKGLEGGIERGKTIWLYINLKKEIKISY